jgi:polyphosphate glucokinase
MTTSTVERGTATADEGAAASSALQTLAIDIGGTGIKMLPLDEGGQATAKRTRELTPRPAHPEAVLKVIEGMLAKQSGFDRVSVGFPGVVVRGVVKTAPNLSTEAWRGFDLHAAIVKLTGKPVRVINDAELQGYGVIRGRGVELVLTLGTGLGSGLYSDGHLVANLELGHHPFCGRNGCKGKTYEQRISDAERKRIGKGRFRRRVAEMIAQLEPILNYDHLYLGGGNAKKLDAKSLPKNVKLFTNVEGMEGGIRLWEDRLAADE